MERCLDTRSGFGQPICVLNRLRRPWLGQRSPGVLQRMAATIMPYSSRPWKQKFSALPNAFSRTWLGHPLLTRLPPPTRQPAQCPAAQRTVWDPRRCVPTVAMARSRRGATQNGNGGSRGQPPPGGATTSAAAASPPRNARDVDLKGVDLSTLTVAQLKDALKQFDMPITGPKKELIKRLQDAMSAASNGTSKPPPGAPAPPASPSTSTSAPPPPTPKTPPPTAKQSGAKVNGKAADKSPGQQAKGSLDGKETGMAIEWSPDMTVPQLREACKMMGLKTTGRKDELIARLHAAASTPPTEEDEVHEEGDDDSKAAGDKGDGRPKASASVAPPPSVDKIAEEVYGAMNTAAMKEWLKARGIQGKGSKGALAKMIAEVILMEEQSQYNSGTDDDSWYAEAQGAGAGALGGVDLMGDDPMGQVTEAELQQYLISLQNMTDDRLLEELRSFGLSGEGMSRRDRIDYLSYELLTMYESKVPGADRLAPTQYADPGFEFPRQPNLPPSPYAQVAQPDPRQYAYNFDSMNVKQIRSELKRLGLPLYGTRQQLVDRLAQALEEAPDDPMFASGAAVKPPRDEDALRQEVTAQAKIVADKVNNMPVKDLQMELAARGLSSRGSKVVLQNRLEQALMEEVEQRLLPPTTAEEQQQTEVDWLVAEGSYVEAEVPLAPRQVEDPPINVSILCGGAGEHWQLQMQSIQAARLVMQQLHDSSTGLNNLREAGAPVPHAPRDQGISVAAYYVDEKDDIFHLPATLLYSCSPQDLTFHLRHVATKLQDVDALVSTIKDTSQVVIPLLRGSWQEAVGLALRLEEQEVQFVGVPQANEISSRSKFHSKLGELGYPTEPLMTASGAAVSAEGVRHFLEEAEVSRDVGLVMVQADTMYDTRATVVARGAEAALEAAQEAVEQDSSGTAVVQPFRQEAAVFRCCVLDSDAGPIALPPTHFLAVDLERDVFEAHLELERHNKMVKGFRKEDIQSDLDSLRRDYEDATIVGEYDATTPSHSGQLVFHHSPPHLSKEVVQRIRYGAAKLFKDLGLRDVACFEGHVLLPPPPPTSLVKTDSSEYVAPPVPDTEDLFFHPYPDPPGWRDRCHNDGEPVELLEEAPPSSYYDYDSDTENIETEVTGDEEFEEWKADMKAMFDDHAEDLAAEKERVEKERAEEEAAKAAAGPPSNKAEDELGLDGIDALTPAQICRSEAGTIFFDTISTTPDLRPSSTLFQQAAEVGLCHRRLLRYILSRSLQRLGMQQLTELPHKVAEGSALLPLSTVIDPNFGDFQDGAADPSVAEDTDFSEGASQFGDGFGSYSEEEWQGWSQYSAGSDNSYLGRDREGPGDMVAGQDYGSAGPSQAGAATSTAVQRVWVVFGGEGAAGEVSLESGRTVWMELMQQPGIQVEAFLLSPATWSAREQQRRQALLNKFVDHLKLGIPEEELPPELQLVNIRNPSPHPLPLESLTVWALPYHLALGSSVEDIAQRCDVIASSASTVPRLQEGWYREGVEVVLQTQMELQFGGVAGVAGMWGGQSNKVSPLPRMMDMGTFVLEAQAAGAVVYNALTGEAGHNGALQWQLEYSEVMFTGPRFMATQLCKDKAATAEMLVDLESCGISSAPKVPLTAQQLLESVDTEQATQQLFDKLKASLGGSPSLCIKPAGDSCSVGVACISSTSDLGWYAAAVAEKWREIPAGTLEHQAYDIPMPTTQTHTFLLEPFITTHSLVVRDDPAEGPVVELTDANRWVEVTVGLVGESGKMAALTPTLCVRKDAEFGNVLTAQDKFLGGDSVLMLTPPPPSIVQQEALKAVKQRVEMVADKLGLTGVAQVDAFMHVDTGELVVVEVNAVTPITPGSPIVQQMLSHSPPIFPPEFLQEVVRLSLIRSELDSDPEFEEADEVYRDAFDDVEEGEDDGEEWSGGQWQEEEETEEQLDQQPV